VGTNTAILSIRILSDAKAAQKGIADTEKNFAQFQNTVDKGAVVAAAGLAAVGAAGLKLAQGAADDQKAATALATQLANTTGATNAQVAAVENWIAKQGQLTGITDDELRPAIGRLATATGDITRAQDLARLAQDVAIGTGKDYSAVVEALAKAQGGNIGALGRLGIATKDTEGKTKSLTQIQADLATTFANQASAQADTFAGKMAIVKTQIGEAGESVGYALMPLLSQLAGFLSQNIGPAIENTTQFFTDHKTAVLAVAAVLAAVGAAFIGVSAGMKIWKTAQTAATAVQWAFNAAMSANPVTLVVLAIAALVAALVWFFTQTDAGKKAWAAFTGFLTSTMDAVVGFFKNAWQWVQDAASGFWSWLTGLPGRIGTALASIPGKLKTLFTDAFNGALQIATDIGGKVLSWITGIPGKIGELGSKFAEAGKNLLQAFLDALKNAAGFVSGLAGKVWDSIKGLLNGAIDKINRAVEFHINAGPVHVFVNPPDIPHLATGGIITRPTLALVGEAGPEAVIPLRGGRGPWPGTVDLSPATITALAGALAPLIIDGAARVAAGLDTRQTRAILAGRR
jgi:hypothetical protein